MSSFKGSAQARQTLAENLRALRSSMNLSQEQLAERAGFHRTYVSQVERCVSNISLDNLQKLADILQVEIWELLRPSA